MRPSIVRLIAVKEVRDLLRDRRTVMLIIILPLLLYPIFGLASFIIAKSLLDQKTTVGIRGAEHLPTNPKLYTEGKFVIKVKSALSPDLDPNKPDDSRAAPSTVIEFNDDPDEAIKQKRFDVVIDVPADFKKQVLEISEPPPKIRLLSRDGDETSKLTSRRVSQILLAWEEMLRDERIQAKGLPKHFDTIFELDDPSAKKPNDKKAAEALRDQFVKVFPFILILWLAAGAVQPAVDITAGERERGTMETLLISPVSRLEIVLGKWLATTLFGFISVLWNVIWLAIGAVVLQVILGSPVVNLAGMFGCVALGLPLAMLFAAIAVTLGVFAKSTKEGQFYQLPLMLGTMPLAFASMVPGQELTMGKAIIPVTGAMLFQQKLLNVSGDPVPWGMAPIVFGTLFIVILLALAIAARQFNREAVLFRESAGGLFGRK